jgi:poly-gamma-glutamate synthesis protein (capsule biosynthesis protein)
MNKITTVFGGDLNIYSSNYNIDPQIIKIFKNSNFSLANLEGPIIQKPLKRSKTPKAGSYLNQTNDIFKYLSLLNIKYVGGANNHVIDYGKTGVSNTEKLLKINNINYNGFGSDLHQASKFIEFGNTKIGYISVCEEEFGIAEKGKFGTHSMYENNLLNQIKSLADKKYTVIIFAHGGIEKVPFTSKYIKERYQTFIDCGAKLVIGHHPHIIQPFEKYNNGYIFYSLGNFLFEITQNYMGMLLKIDWINNKINKLEPIIFEANGKNVKISHDNNILKVLKNISILQSNKKIYDRYHQIQSIYLYKDHYEKYLTGLFCNNDKKRKFKDELLLLHLLRNKSHAEFIEEALKIVCKETSNQINKSYYNKFIKMTKQILYEQ